MIVVSLQWVFFGADDIFAYAAWFVQNRHFNKSCLKCRLKVLLPKNY